MKQSFFLPILEQKRKGYQPFKQDFEDLLNLNNHHVLKSRGKMSKYPRRDQPPYPIKPDINPQTFNPPAFYSNFPIDMSSSHNPSYPPMAFGGPPVFNPTQRVNVSFDRYPTYVTGGASYNPPPMAFGAPPGYNNTPLRTNTLPSGYTQPNSSAPVPSDSPPSYSQSVNIAGMPYPANVPGMAMPPSPLGGSSACVSQVELSIKCQNLLDTDVLSKSDPLVCCFMMCAGNWIEKGRTECVMNNLNPDFSRKIKLDYYFEESQKLKFEVYDIDNFDHQGTPLLQGADFIGMMECTLGQIVSSASLSKPLLYRSGSKIGSSSITIFAEEVDTNHRDILKLSFRAEKLDNKEWFGRSDPFLEFRKIGPDGKMQMIHRTEFVKSNLNPVWKPFEVRQQSLGGDNIETEIYVTCYDYERNGSHKYIGECKISLRELLEGQAERKVWPCINVPRQKSRGTRYKNSGIIYLNSCVVTRAHSFLDYVFGGTQINFTVAIDFTASNGDPRKPNSLHYIHPHQPNEYTSAIWAVGGVVQDYDSDKMFPALGFGAKIPPNYTVSHEFALNFDMTNPFCAGVEALVQAYQNCLMQIQLYGPTNFAPVINHVARFAREAHLQTTPENYFILLILTDGVVTDLPDTTRAIVQASGLPLSIIIVGVGQADFSNMELLDGDEERLRAPDGTLAQRDIVQFVPYHKFKNSDPAYLAKEVLAEVPHQLTEYYKLRNIPPKAPIFPRPGM